MPSNLLEQAMIDAVALKEAAMKNAESALIEKYSHEFNEAVQKLLEQEDLALTPPTDPAAVPPVDPAAAPAPDLSDIDPMAGDLSMTGDMGQNKAFSKVPGSFSGGDDDEMVTINFDQIKAALNEAYDLNGQDPTPDALAQGKANPDVVVKMVSKEEMAEADAGATEADVVVKIVGGSGEEESEEMELELEDDSGFSNTPPEDEVDGLEEVELVEQEPDVAPGMAEKARAADLKAQAASVEAVGAKKEAEAAKMKAEKDAAAAAAQAASSDIKIPTLESIELTEEELMELAEELKVDLKVGNMSDGWMGSTETQKREQRNVELAAARDEEAAKNRDDEKAKMGDLIKENSEMKKLNSDALGIVAALKDQIEKLNLLNAKLLYTNKALGNVSLNERQKMNIVESISKADSVLAAKTIYDTLQNAIENTAKEHEAPQSLREALNKAATPFVVRRNSNNSLNDLMAERMKTLAGIKKLS